MLITKESQEALVQNYIKRGYSTDQNIGFIDGVEKAMELIERIYNPKQFYLFAGDDYYPSGGGRDFRGAYSSVEEAMKAHPKDKFQYDGGWANIFDTKTNKTVKYFYHGKWKNK